MLEHVGQRLLDDAVGRHVHTLRQRRVVTVDEQADLQASGAEAVGQRGQLADARLRGAAGLLVWVAEHAEQAAGFGQGLPSAVLDFLQGRRIRPARGPRPGGVQHDHAEVVGDDVVQFPADPGPLRRRGLLGLALQARAPRGQRGSLPAGADENAGHPERQELQRCQFHDRQAGMLGEDQPQRAHIADFGHDRGGNGQAGDRAAQAGVRAQRVGGGKQRDRELQALRRGTARVHGEQGLRQRHARAGRQPRQQWRAAAQHQRRAHQQGQQRPQHQDPVIAVPIRPGGPHTATAVSPAAAIPVPASAMRPASPPANRRTAHMPPKVAPDKAMRIIREPARIQPCD